MVRKIIIFIIMIVILSFNVSAFIDFDTFTRADNLSMGKSEGTNTSYTETSGDSRIIDNQMLNQGGSLNTKLSISGTVVTWAINTTLTSITANRLGYLIGDSGVHDSVCGLEYYTTGQIHEVGGAVWIANNTENVSDIFLIVADTDSDQCTYYIDGVLFNNSGAGFNFPVPLTSLNQIRFNKVPVGAGSWVVEDYFVCQDNNITCYPSVTPVLTSNLDILFKNVTGSSKTTFDEGENFNIFINLTYSSNGSSIPDSACNITMEGALTEEESVNPGFTLCDSVSCDEIIYTENFTQHETTNAIDDLIHFNTCHLNLASGTFDVKMQCGSNTFTETINPGQISLCSSGNTTIFVNSSICTSFDSFNVTLNSTGLNFAQRKSIFDLEIDREYSNHTNIFNDDVFYNSTSGLYFTSHDHEYYKHGSKNIFANCANNNPVLNNNIIEQITIVNLLPVINFNQVSNEGGTFSLFNGANLEYFFGNWSFFLSIIDDDLDIAEINFYNGTGNSIGTFNLFDVFNNRLNFPFTTDTIKHQPNVIAMYRFEEGSGTDALDELNLNNGIHNATYLPSSSNVEGDFALDFDGTGSILNISDSDRFNTFNATHDLPFSISAWINMDNINAFRIAHKGTGTGVGQFFFSTDGAGKLQFRTVDDSASANIGKRMQGDLSSWQNEWVHIVGTYNGSADAAGFEIYINGSRITATDQVTGGVYIMMEDTADPINIGYLLGDGRADGSIDEIIFYNRTLSPSEVLDIRLNGALNSTTTPLPWTDFDANPFNISVFANDTFGGSTFASILFTVNDTFDPVCTDLQNRTVANGSSFQWNIACTDEFFFSYNVSCNNGYSFFEDSINSQSYSFTESTNFTNETFCRREYCDGHTDKSIKNMQVTKDISRNSISFDGTEISINAQVNDISFTKKEDRYSFCYHLKKKTEMFKLYIPNNCEPAPEWSPWKGHMLCGNTKQWIDLMGDHEVIYDGVGAFNIYLNDPSKKDVCFNSIGKFNCVSDEQNFTIAPPLGLSIISPLNGTSGLEFDPDLIFNTQTLSNCSLIFNGSLIFSDTNLSGTRSTKPSFLLENTTYSWNVTCSNDLSLTESTGLSYFTTLELDKYALRTMECPDDLTGMFLEISLIFISLLLLAFSYTFKHSMPGIFGSLIMLILSFSFFGCSSAIGGLMFMFGILFLWFFLMSKMEF